MTAMPWLQRGVERFMSEDRVALESFQRDHFGADSPLLDDTHFHWLFEEPPTPDPEGVQLWVCKRNGGIVGQQAGIPFALKVGERVRRASWAIDLMVAPEWRLRGVGPGLSETHAAAGEVSVSLSMTDAAYKSYKRAGWLDLGNVPTYLRVIDPPRCLRVSPYDGGLARLVARLGKPAMGAASVLGHAAARTFGARLVEVDSFDERMDGLWEAAAPQHLCAARRDHAFLQWRFDKIPNAARHRRFLVTRRDTVMAYVVLRVDRWRGESVGVVCDYLARPGWLMPAFSLLVERARRERMAALVCRTLNAQAARPLSMMGFLCLKNGLRQPTRMMARPAADRQDLTPLVGDPRNWFVTAADSDMGFKDLGE
ncbi:GNAT family N-acetyltransferase [Roseomonas genomospecies 6]|uniref:GNAT family N-acetyltransferase n=2 Tax=Roseomonas genomospecies 6 TaxID=214106 RepID=A0A9W7KPZ2_9PROT|nr:GNAT family N-acetyltransferase [Roseomonas genomospecies 6]